MVEKLNTKRVAFSLAGVAGIIYLICAILVTIAPIWTINVFGALFHGIDISQIATTPTLANTAIGFVEIIALALIIGWLFAIIYNKVR